MHSLNTFGVRTSHGQLRFHKTHHGLDLGKPPPPPYSIFYVSPRVPHPNGILSWDSQVGVPELPQLRFLRLWGPITSCADLQLWWGLKRSCSPRRKLSNNMLHAACTQGNWVTLGLSLDHNLCFRCPNGLCEPILDTYVSIIFQWYKKLLELMGFNFCNYILNIRKSIWDSNSHNGSSFGSVRAHSLHSQASLLARNLATPLFCLGHEPKVKVATTKVMDASTLNLWEVQKAKLPS